MRRRGGRGGRGRTSRALLDQLRAARGSALQDVRSLEIPDRAPEGVEIGEASGSSGERFAVVAASRDTGDLLGWAHVATALMGGDGPWPELVVAAPAFSRQTREAAVRTSTEGVGVRLITVPALAEKSDASLGVEMFPERGDVRLAPAPTTLARVVQVIEGAAAVAGVGAVRSIPGGYALYMRGAVVLRIESEGEQVLVHCLEPERRRVQVSEETLPRWGVELHETVVNAAQDPRLMEAGAAGREAAIPEVASAARCRVTGRCLAWSHDGRDPVDWVGIDSGGRPVLGLVRASFGLGDVPGVLAALDVFEQDRGSWAPGSKGRPRVLLASSQVESRAKSLLAALGLDVQVRAEVASGEIRPAHLGAADRSDERRGRRRGRRRRQGRESGPEESTGAEAEAEQEPEQEPEPDAPVEARADGPPNRPAEDEVDREELNAPEQRPAPERGRGDRRRRRPRRRGRSEAPRGAPGEPDEPRLDGLAPDGLPVEAATAPGIGEPEPIEELEESIEEGDELSAEEEVREPEEPEVEPAPQRPRRSRAAIVVRDDPDAILAALVLARERRHLTQFWVCSQNSLMDYFKTGATDLPENVDLLVVGFTAQPVPHEVIRTADLYRGRLHWFDNHEWPVDDLEILRKAIGDDCVSVEPGAASPLAAVMAIAERRSRFTDKLVDLSSRRLSENDMRKWGFRLIGLLRKLAASPGDHRQEIHPILSGKPAELPDAGDVYAAESAWIESHDPRIVYFGEYGMAVAHLPENLDAGEVSRRLREQTGARLSLASRDGDDVVMLGCNEEKRHINALALVDHLADKLPWAQSRPGGDRLGRLEIEDLARHPERLEIVLAELVKSKSILYG